MGDRKQILIVDDDASLAMALTVELESAGFLVLHSKNGKEGFTKIVKSRPDLVVLDIVMPELNGIEMLEKLRLCKSVYCKTVPVVILTNLTSEKALKKAAKLDCSDYIIKSDISLHEIKALVGSRLKKEEQK